MKIILKILQIITETQLVMHVHLDKLIRIMEAWPIFKYLASSFDIYENFH